MLNSKYAKSKEILLNTPQDLQRAMKNFIEYFCAENELRADISDRFNYPSLWAAIDRLLEYREEQTVAYINLKASGYTTDDAFMLAEYENE